MTSQIRKPIRPDETMRTLPKAWRRYIKELEYYADIQEGRARGFLGAIKLASKKEAEWATYAGIASITEAMERTASAIRMRQSHMAAVKPANISVRRKNDA